MAVKPNATFRFTDYLVDDDGIHLHYVCLDPGGGESSDYYLLMTFAEAEGITNLASYNAWITARLQRNIRAAGIASKLDSLIGRAVTI